MAALKKISLSEEDLVLALKNKDTFALNELYDKYSGSLLGVISRIVQQTELAEDLLQETFIKIWNSIEGYDSTKGRLFTWMMNIARNLSIDKLRSKDFKNSIKNQDIENNVDLIDAHKKVTFNSDILGIKEMVTTLRPEYTTLLHLIYFRGYTHVEAAEELEIPIGTVKTRIRMAIMELRKNFN